MEENGLPETWSKKQIEAMKFQYAYLFKILAEDGSYIIKNFWLNIANMDSQIDKILK